MVEKIVYTMQEVSELLNVSISTVYNIINRGELPLIRIMDYSRVMRTELTGYLKNNTKRATL